MFQGLVGSSVSEAVALQAQGPGLDSQNNGLNNNTTENMVYMLVIPANQPGLGGQFQADEMRHCDKTMTSEAASSSLRM